MAWPLCGQTGDDEDDIAVAENIARALQIDIDKLVPDAVPAEHVRALAQLQGVINFLVDDLLPADLRRVRGAAPPPSPAVLAATTGHALTCRSYSTHAALVAACAVRFGTERGG